LERDQAESPKLGKVHPKTGEKNSKCGTVFPIKGKGATMPALSRPAGTERRKGIFESSFPIGKAGKQGTHGAGWRTGTLVGRGSIVYAVMIRAPERVTR